MRWSEIGGVPCSVARALSVVGDRWVMLVLREAFLGTRRFEDFHERVGASRRVLAERLAGLVEDGVLDRVRYSERPDRFEYRLTDKGRDLHTVLTALRVWGDRWMADDQGPPVTVVHRTCGAAMDPVMVCPDCRDEIDPRDLTAVVHRGPVRG